MPTFEDRVNSIAWGNFGTAYGPAMKVPDQLQRLGGPDRKAALEASHQLWCGLCHQHSQIASAALPALPFLLEVLDTADRDLTVELLDILLGFAIGVKQQDAVEHQRSLDQAIFDERWVAELRALMLAELPRLQRLATSSDDEVADFAKWIIAELHA